MKTLLLIMALFSAANVFASEDCSTAAKDATNAIVQLNAARLGITESAISVEKASQGASKQSFVVTTKSGEDNTYEWKVETSNNCQVSSVIFVGGN